MGVTVNKAVGYEVLPAIATHQGSLVFLVPSLNQRLTVGDGL